IKIKTDSWIRLLLVIIFVLVLSACKKFVEIPPPITELTTSSVFESDAKADEAMLGIYSGIMENVTGYSSGGMQSFTTLSALSSDEMINYYLQAGMPEFYLNQLTISNPTNLALWNATYNNIYQVNAILEGIQSSNGMTIATRQRIEGEARFLRAFFYFYLVNYWGDIPFTSSTDYQANSKLSRKAISEVYASMEKDLQVAVQNLPDDYIMNGERIRPNKGAAEALMARVNLFEGNWAAAESYASLVINNSGYYQLDSNLQDVFLMNSSEAIWQLMPVVPYYNSSEGFNFILLEMPQLVSLSNQLVNAFEPGDLRRAGWIDSIDAGGQLYYFPYKYKIKGGNVSDPLLEYTMVLRLAEQYLIRAEARARLSNFIGAQEDLNIIRHRAGLLNTSANDLNSLLIAIEHERQVELFTEWGGFRWLDLKRMGRADAVLGPIKAGNWQPDDTLYPIPEHEIQNDPFLTQNPGY
ncbi:MAG TPA: RagB/SusD family nutrient uptake outer membrane protein, partial [Puia sp.]|nr:RagB/SusD family nutrient uptake outer membrane protein [Puia sp.]